MGLVKLTPNVWKPVYERQKTKVTFYLYEYDTGEKFGVASEENQRQYTEALQSGKSFITYPYHGYSLRMVVRKGAFGSQANIPDSSSGAAT